ncbi:hypothetical protein C8Q78DRAFT_971235 [Trametes maxima]|nr:hypothetical protein C8Q78DRAFT_971235 [Trametes maxima]
MATTTQILFNSPALHSLKRDQLVKLCKIHSIKANGKNSELIERLKQHAQALPPEALNSSADEDDAMDVEEEGLPGGFPVAKSQASSSGDDYAMEDAVLTSRFGIPRPSEQWEVVMDDIEEVDESGMGNMSSKGSLRTVSNGEFGTQTSKGSVTSSLKALATSLGIKRPGGKSSREQDNEGTTSSKRKDLASLSPSKVFSTRARDSLADHATPYSQLPPADTLPETDDFKFSTPDASILGVEGDEEDGPVPGGSGRAGKPAPLGARLSMGVGQSTIRLVTHPAAPRLEDAYMSPPRLAPIQPDFDITMGTPSAGRILSVWPASPHTAGVGTDGTDRIYPQLPLADLEAARRGMGKEADRDGDAPMPGGMGASPSTPVRARTTTTSTITASTPGQTNTPGPIDEPDMFSPAKPSAAAPSAASAAPSISSSERATIPRTAPFLFGSPLPRRETPRAGASVGQDADEGAGISNTAFADAANSVLAEMQRRLAEAQKEREKNGETRPAPSSALAGSSIFGGFDFGGSGAAAAKAGSTDRFSKAHEAQFARMDSIADHYAARRPAGTSNVRKRKSNALGPGAPAGPRAGQKRRSSAAGTRVISNGVRKKMAVPGGFDGEEEDASDGRDGDDDEDEDGDEGDAREKDEVEDVGARRSSKRMRINEGWDVHAGRRVSIAPPMSPMEEEKKQKERDAVKRQLDAAKARRRSSRGRASIGGKAAPPAKAKASRFGFLSSAKSIVRNVWNMGGKAKAPATANPSSIPVPKASSSTAPTKIDAAQKTGKLAGDAPAAPKPSTAAAPPPQNARKPSGSHTRVPSMSSTSGKQVKPSAPSVAVDAKATGTVTSTRSSGAMARSPIPSFAPLSIPNKTGASASSRPSSIVGTTRSRVSSAAGTTTSSSRQSVRTSTVSSLGTRTSLASGSSSTAVSSIGTRRSLASTNTLASTNSKADVAKVDGKEPSVRKRTSSLLAPTASSLAKVNAAARPSASGRSSGLPSVSENNKRPTAIPGPSKSPANVTSSRMSPMSLGRIFSQPLTNFGSPASSTASPTHHPSLGAVASTLLANADDSSPSKIPRPAVIPPKPKALIARKPRISRSRVIAKVGAQRAAAAQGSASSPNARTRSSFGARRSFGGVKSAGRVSAGAEIMRGAAKKRARQSEYIRRKSRAGASENQGAAGEA